MEDNNIIDELAEAIKSSGAKVVFGIKRHIPYIEGELARFEGAKFCHHTWNRIGKEIGWEPFTACLWYFQYIEQEKQKQQDTEKPRE